MSVHPLRPTLNESTWNNLLELFEDSPEQFELLALHLARENRPIWGSVTIRFQGGKITVLDKQESLKV